MADDELDLLGPIDYTLIGFPGTSFGDQMAKELLALVDAGVVRIYDLVVIQKEADGSYHTLALDDLPADEVGGFGSFAGASSGLVADSDVAESADAMEPGTTAVLLVFENSWAAKFARAVRAAGGQLRGYDRIPIQAILDALDEAEAVG